MTALRKLRLLSGVAMACATLSMSCDPEVLPPPPADITVTLNGTTAADPALLLYSGKEASACVSFDARVGTPTVTLNDVTLNSSCQVEIDAFAPDFGAFAHDVDPLDPTSDDWFLAAIASGALTIEMPGLTTLPLRIWLVAPLATVPTVEGVRDRLLDKAYPVLASFGAGFTLDTTSTVLDPSLLPTASCGASNAISTNPAIYDASKINVYFVAYYGNNPGLSPARNCWMQSHNEIVFISYDNANVTDPTLVHELGHALGLIHPRIPDGGHTYLVSGFDPFNLMATNTDVTDVTVGQLYAMNFSSDSWINRSGSPLLKPVVRTCQDTWGAGVCPALTLTQSGWPP